jgi:APA family basic amino acid/polyamine antiporter
VLARGVSAAAGAASAVRRRSDQPAALNGAAVLTLWALLGFECASLAARQVENPERMSRAPTIWGAALTGLLYLVVCSAIALLLPTEVAVNSPAPFATFVEALLERWAGGAGALFATVSCVGPSTD